MIDKENAAEIDDWRHRLLEWFATHQRPLPWRTTYTPYHVWISEIMGQQTQMERVAQYFIRWIERFPDLASVAAAPEQAILKAWEGLGYYSRARNLQRAAVRLLETGTGEVPADYQQLIDLPGIGPYTAGALLSIAFNLPYPLLDANVERLFARLADIGQPLKQGATKKRLAAMAETLLDRENPRQLQSSPHGTGRLDLHSEKAGLCSLPGADALPGLPGRHRRIPSPAQQQKTKNRHRHGLRYSPQRLGILYPATAARRYLGRFVGISRRPA